MEKESGGGQPVELVPQLNAVNTTDGVAHLNTYSGSAKDVVNESKFEEEKGGSLACVPE